jgi:D-alanyl-D-alanine carboxypeptidase
VTALRVLTGSLAIVLSATGSALAAEATLPAAQVAAIDAAARGMIAHQHVPSIVIVVNRDGKRVFARAWGTRNAADRLPATVDTLYQYGSITKQFTAMSIFLLAQDGKLSLDDRIGKYLPAFADKPVSIRQLLIHTSGLSDPIDAEGYDRLVAPQIAIGWEPILARSAREQLTYQPGGKAAYNNTGYVALARIVERVGGMPFDRFLATRIFNVAGMRTATTYQYLTIRRNAALGYLWGQGPVAPLVPASAGQGIAVDRLVNAPPWNLRQGDGAGYLVGDATELQRWDDALLAGKFLRGAWRQSYFSAGKLGNGSPAVVGAENKTKQNVPYYCYGGLAKVVIQGHPVFFANGGTFGFSTFTATIPDRHVSVTMLTNLGRARNDEVTVPLITTLLE